MPGSARCDAQISHQEPLLSRATSRFSIRAFSVLGNFPSCISCPCRSSTMPSQPAFVFVNKTAESASLTRSHGKERLEIFSHVQSSQIQQTDNNEFVLVTPANFASSKPSTYKQMACSYHGKGMRRVKEVGGLHFDPFQTLGIRMTRSMQSLLAYCDSPPLSSAICQMRC